MADYRVNLDIFAGPLDLLLYLVRKEEVDIYDIPIARITEQYIRYIDILKNLDIDLAADFLVMAATLMQIKSAMLLPRAEPGAIDVDELSDPRAELIRQLLEYKRFKDAANLLSAAADEQRERFSRPDTIIEQLKPQTEPEIDLDHVSIWDLLEAFDKIMEATGAKLDISHIADDTPIDLYQIELLHRLQTEGAMPMERIFASAKSRLIMVGLFLALLELIRDGLVWAEQFDPAHHEQSEPVGSIYLKALTDEPAEQAVRKAILAAAEAEQAAEQPVPSGEQNKPPIPIAELPPKTGPEQSLEKLGGHEDRGYPDTGDNGID
jgi:segregation and condensation protein A